MDNHSNLRQRVRTIVNQADDTGGLPRLEDCCFGFYPCCLGLIGNNMHWYLSFVMDPCIPVEPELPDLSQTGPRRAAKL
ncbi:hypothetical protein PanWU01x14_028840 [Parasponia andersonii]|uniref:Uncharacterized protein n=1 Tax=Parasponia andersonii TaxID=3476 RepID=A0A2P5DVE3_PARAD|nr:hypothetical protein PanWU01x14_028840 [Parasponia andersonii]